MSGIYVLALVATFGVAFTNGASLVKRSVDTQDEQEAYFLEFGYMVGPNSPSSIIAALKDEDPKKAFEVAVKAFQHMAGLNITGKVDEATKEMMKMPRCGVKDNVNMANIARRKKRYATEGSRWDRPSLTYKITRFTSDLSTTDQRDEIRRALKVWSDVTPLTFTETNGTPDIEIKFAAGSHGDSFPFDGPGRTLAHAFFPRWGGDAHFDDDESFTKNSYSGSNLFQVAAHEFGHSLGLGHSDVQSALMAPFYRGYQPNFSLDYDDIRGIQAIYGRAPTVTNAPTRSPTQAPTVRTTLKSGTTPEPDRDYCRDATFDAITTYKGVTYAFRGDKVMMLEDTGIADGWPRRIADTIFRQLPSNLDAAVYWPDSNQGPARTYFFKGSLYWRYNENGLQDGYPKEIYRGFGGLPGDIDSAFVWSGNDVTYFTKGDKYYRYRRGYGIESGYPRNLNLWTGLPSRIDAAFQWKNGRTYFFQGPNYYRFDDNNFRVDYGYPRLNSLWWLGCPSNTGSIQDQDSSNPQLEMEEDSNQFVDIQPESSQDDLDNVYSGQGPLTVMPLFLTFSFVICFLF